MDIDNMHDKYTTQKQGKDDIVNEVCKLLYIVAKEHVVLEGLEYTWRDNNLSLYIETDGMVYITSDDWFKFNGMRRKVKRYLFGGDDIRKLPACILSFIRSEIAKHIDEMNKSIDELYTANSSTILNYLLSTEGGHRISCPAHGLFCGEMITKLRTIIAALAHDIRNITSSISIGMSIFDEIVLTKRTTTGTITFRCDSLYQPKYLFSVSIDDLSPSKLKHLHLSTFSIQRTRELANFRNNLYNSTRIQPITLDINL